MTQKSITDALDTKVSTTRKINSLSLTADINIQALTEVRNFNGENVDFIQYVESHAHQLSSYEEIKFVRFFDEENWQSLHYPCIDSHMLIMTIDNSAAYIRVIAFAIRTNDVYSIVKSSNNWGTWVKLH